MTFEKKDSGKKSANYKICVRKENSTKKRFSAKN